MDKFDVSKLIAHSIAGGTFDFAATELPSMFTVATQVIKVCDIEDYIINKNATIIFWDDDTKTVVKRSKDDEFDIRLGFLTAYFQKHCGMSKTKANKFLDNLKIKESKGE